MKNSKLMILLRGIIMENPDIIARIKDLADSDKTVQKAAAEPIIVEDAGEKERASENTTEKRTDSKKRRRELLTALKPYVKSERARAIDTMLSVIDVIDVMKER